MAQGITRSDIESGAIIPSKLGTELRRFSQIIHVGDMAIDSDAIVNALWKIPAQMTAGVTIKRILMMVDTAVTAADTNYNTYAITDGTNTIASVANGPAATGQSFTAGAFVELTLVADYVDQAAGNTLKLTSTKTGNGLAMSGMNIQIDYEVNDPS
jgi:hypothetical protein